MVVEVVMIWLPQISGVRKFKPSHDHVDLQWIRNGYCLYYRLTFVVLDNIWTAFLLCVLCYLFEFILLYFSTFSSFLVVSGETGSTFSCSRHLWCLIEWMCICKQDGGGLSWFVMALTRSKCWKGKLVTVNLLVSWLYVKWSRMKLKIMCRLTFHVSSRWMLPWLRWNFTVLLFHRPEDEVGFQFLPATFIFSPGNGSSWRTWIV